MKKIVYIITGLQTGGAERVVMELVSRLDRTMFAPQVVWMIERQDDLLAQLRARGVRVTCIPKKTKLGLQMLHNLTAWLKVEKPDIVHTHLFAADVWGTAAAVRAGVPHIISTQHSYNNEESWLKERVKAWARRHQHVVVAVSETVKQSLLQDHGEGFLHKLRVIYNGVDTQRFTGSVKRSQLPAVIATVGRLEVEKGQMRLLRAIRRLRTQVVLRIVGNGTLRDALIRRVQDLGITEQVRFEPARKDIEVVYQDATIVVIPSVEEGFGLVAVEALASGCPVIASRIPAFSEILTDGTNGVLVDMQNADEVASAIDRLAADSTLRERLAEAGQRMVREQFSIERMVSHYTELYNTLP